MCRAEGTVQQGCKELSSWHACIPEAREGDCAEEGEEQNGVGAGEWLSWSWLGRQEVTAGWGHISMRCEDKQEPQNACERGRASSSLHVNENFTTKPADQQAQVFFMLI